MATTISPVISVKSPYYIDRNRYLELKYFCMQYPMWIKAYHHLDGLMASPDGVAFVRRRNKSAGDPTAKVADAAVEFARKITMVEKAAFEANEILAKILIKGVTEGLSYDKLRASYDVPCGRDMYYDYYRKFFWILSKMRD